jgi:hypothetical protein
MTHVHATDDSGVRTERPLATRVATVAATAIGGALLVWFFGFDPLWSVAAVLAVGPAASVIAGLAFDESTPWERAAREVPRHTRLTVANIEASLAACDRLARPPIMRSMGALVMTERDDRAARLAIIRRMRDLLVAELAARGLDATDSSAVAALLGPDALTVLEPNEDTPVTAAAIARCLDRIERLDTATQGS